MSHRVMEIYFQEVAALTFMADLSEAARGKVLYFFGHTEAGAALEQTQHTQSVLELSLDLRNSLPGVNCWERVFFRGEDFPSHVIHPAKERLDTLRAWEKKGVRATGNSDEQRMVDLLLLLKLPPSRPSLLRSFSRGVFFRGDPSCERTPGHTQSVGEKGCASH